MPDHDVVDAVSSAAEAIFLIRCIELLHRQELLGANLYQISLDLGAGRCGSADNLQIVQAIQQSNPAKATV